MKIEEELKLSLFSLLKSRSQARKRKKATWEEEERMEKIRLCLPIMSSQGQNRLLTSRHLTFSHIHLISLSNSNPTLQARRSSILMLIWLCLTVKSWPQKHKSRKTRNLEFLTKILKKHRNTQNNYLSTFYKSTTCKICSEA